MTVSQAQRFKFSQKLLSSITERLGDSRSTIPQDGLCSSALPKLPFNHVGLKANGQLRGSFGPKVQQQTGRREGEFAYRSSGSATS